MTSRGLLDTSVFIAAENRRRLDEELLPDESAISVITIAELHAGVLAAPNVESRAARLATLNSISDVISFPIDDKVAQVWARLRVHLAENGRRVNVNDLWIAASAAAHGLTLFSQDDDFQPLEGVAGLTVVQV
ncbi:MAG TPA: type II toxin-antitoxin system VapC family toxin [Mycobacteriales bacterium]|jgi:hypothetical protein|nr:type II toxin-antitoxin system VapC family toxin [Mycobacteriales bacterium]